MTTSRGRRPRVSIFAYAGEPGRGSEPGAGWGIARAASEFADCVVLSGPEHTPALQAWASEHGHQGLTFVEVPEPPLAALAKRHRVTWFLLYLIWLQRAYDVGRRLHVDHPFDLVCHATYSVYWLPTPAVDFGVPLVWGPVGGAVTTPRSLWPLLGWRGLPGELLDFVAVRLLAKVPATRRTWCAAAACLVQNEATWRRLPEEIRATSCILNHSVFAEVPQLASRARSHHLVQISALEARKGVALAIHALARTPDHVHLRIAGKGPERKRLERLAKRLRVADRVTFLGELPRAEALDLLTSAAGAVFTGLREEGGMALSEAMLCGVPVIVLANGGAQTLAAATLDSSRVALIEPGSVEATAERMAEAMTRFSGQPSAATGPMLDRAAFRTALEEVFREALARDARQEHRLGDPA